MVGRDAASIAATASKMLLLVACAVDVVVNGFRLCHALSIACGIICLNAGRGLA